jgi:hypothetical protein
MEFTDQNIGAKLFESITGGLYDGNPNCLREYIQNSIDHGAKNIEIRRLMGGRVISIKDDGPGMSSKEIVKALSLGVSEKDETMAGWRGIGTWSGIPSCLQLVFITKKRNHPKLRVVVDNEKIRAHQESANATVAEVFLNDITDPIEEPLGKDESIENTHFTEVRLESILPTQEYWYSEEIIKNYLQKVIPAPFDEKKFKFAKEINEWLLNNGVKYREAKVFFNGERIYRAPFETESYYDAVVKPVFLDGNSNVIAVGWLLSLKHRKKSKWPRSGILFKKKGYTIGDENFIQQYFIGTFHQWQYGELHIVSKDIRENSARDGFEFNHGKIQGFLDWVKKEAAVWENINRYKTDVGKTDTVNKIRSLLDLGNVDKAKQEVKNLEEGLTTPRSYPKASYLASLKPQIDATFTKNLSELKDIKSQIKQAEKEGKSDIVRQRRELYWAIVDTYPLPMRQDLKRVRKGHEGDLIIAALDSLERLIENKTGLKERTFHNLTQKAFGWHEVKAGNHPPILEIDPTNPALNRQFGVLIYTIHNLFENKFKHERGQETFKWYFDAPEEEKILLRMQLNSIAHFCYRMIETADVKK